MSLFFMPKKLDKKNENNSKRYFVIDFDSTFVQEETLDVLAEIALEGNPKKDELLAEVLRVTAQGMEGKIPFSESLKKRLALFSANKNHVDAVIEHLKVRITPSFARNKAFFLREKGNVYIVSSGFKECILPVVAEFGIDEDHVLANTLRFDSKGALLGVKKGALSEDSGKVQAVKALKLKGDVIVIGDGMTDFEIKKSGVASRFYALTENVSRAPVVSVADLAVGSLEEVLLELDLPRAQSYPKSKLKVLLLENIHALAAEHFTREGYVVEVMTKALSESELAEKIRDVSILGIRSATHVTKTVLENAPHLLAIGAFCIGTNQIDVKEASRRGIAVFNAPYANGRSVVELVVGYIIMLFRRIGERNADLHRGVWNKSAKGAHEIRGKTIGIVGYGNIGSQLSVVAESLGMNVLFYDLVERSAIGNAKRAESLHALLSASDVVSLHIDGRPANRLFIGKAAFDTMKNGAFFINASRGAVIDVAALADSLNGGKLAGAALDVFPEEPNESPAEFSSVLQNIPNVVLTPHIGGATSEAQESIARYLSKKLSSFIDAGNTMLCVNCPNLQLPELKDAHRFIHIHKNVPGVLAKINTLMGEHKINIVGQFLGTSEEIGYVITDVNATHDSEIIKKLKEMPETIRLRALY